MTDMLYLPLNVLRFGHEATPPINARRVGRDVAIPELAASIAAHGQIQALSVENIEDEWFVADGNRRLAAQRLRAERGEIAPDEPIKCDIGQAGADAEETSVAANVMREPLHSADTYESFVDLTSRGMSPEQIAARFGIEPARVNRMLALGKLSPLILEAWRAGTFGRDEIGCVRAFTLAPTIAEQERAFKKLAKDGQLYPHQIRNLLGAGNQAASRFLKTCGKEAYIAAGGRIGEDLFGDNHVIYDVELAEQLAADRIVAEIERVAAEGWSWVAQGDTLPPNWSYSWSKLTAETGKPTRKEARQLRDLELITERPGALLTEDGQKAEREIAELKAAFAARGWNEDQLAKAGAVVHLAHNGELQITRGVLKPAAARKESAAVTSAAPAGPKGPAVISNALHQRLSGQATLATRVALQEEPRLGLAALLAGFMAHRHMATDSPIRVYHEGFGKAYGGEKESFADAFRRLSDMTDQDLIKVAAGIASEAVHLERHNVGRLPFDDNAGPLAAAIDPARITAALQQNFDAQDYFTSASKPIVVQAIREAVNEDEARKAEKMKKADRAEFAMKNVAPTGWLPPELRPATYSGPGAVQ